MATIKKPMKKAQSGISALKYKDAKKPTSSVSMPPKEKKKGAMDAVREVGKYVSTFGGATERDNPKQKDVNIVKKLKETGSTVKKKLGMKSGGAVKAKNGKSFPDLNKDGKITKADILKGRGVIAKKGKTIKKAQLGGLLDKVVGGLGKSAGGFSKIKDMFGNSGFGNAGLGMINSLRKKKQASAQAPAPAMKKGGKVAKKMQYGGAAASMVPPMMKKGGATKKCKYGCK